ncbi:hypothetical protein [Candidatus Avelusimicrobium facis]|uniref:hypothetical protein n=1 Tax=Candidatus Avelusimicrobium facis TaxID=3416203 RepID=UPI0015B5292A
MKKLLGLLLVLTMAWPVSAEVFKDVNLVGEIQTIAFDARHDGSNEFGSGTKYRVLAGVSAELVEDVRANVLFQYNNVWNGSAAGDNLQHYWDHVKLAEANVVLSNLFDCFEATVGRQFYGDEDSAVLYLGPNHYVFNMNAAPSLDAAKLTYSDDFKAVTLVAGKIKHLAYDSDVYGADVKLNLTDAWQLQAYGYDIKNSEDEVGYDGKHYGFYGAKATFAPQAFAVSAEYARGFEGHRLVKEGHDTPYMVKADGALYLEAFTPRATFYYAKGVVSLLGNYYPGLAVGHLLAGLNMPLSDYSDGIRLFNVGVDYAWNKFVFSLDGFSFQDRTAQQSSTWEADLVAKYNHNEYVQLFAGLGYAKYSAADQQTQFAKDNTVGQVGMLIKF